MNHKKTDMQVISHREGLKMIKNKDGTQEGNLCQRYEWGILFRMGALKNTK
jgi:hypothetical protein